MSGVDTRARASSTRRLVPAGQGGELGLGVEVQPVQHPFHLLVAAPAVAPSSVVGGQPRAVPAGDDIEDRTGQPLRHVLGDQRHLQPLLAVDLAAVGRQLAGDQLQQGRLAGAVAPQQAEPLARLDLQVDAVEQRRAAEGHADVPQTDQCHRITPAEFFR